MSRARILAVVMLVAVTCYAGTLANGFVFDDVSVILGNPLVTSGDLPIGAIFGSHYWAHVRPEGNLHRPLTVLSYALNHLAFGPDPRSWHAVNVLLHALCSALAAVIALSFGLGPAAALAAGTLFAAHPVHAEAVAYVVGRADLMAAAAVMAAWILHLGARRASPARLAGIATVYAAGLLSKESAVALPGLMLAGDAWRSRRREASWRETLPATAICLAVTGAWLLLRAVLLPGPGPGSLTESLPAAMPASHRIATALSVMPRYLWLMIWPARLSADYSYDQIPAVTSLADPVAVGGLLVYLGIAATGLVRILLRPSPRLDGVCAAAWLVALAPVSNIVVPMGTEMAERLVYLPSIAFCLVLPALWREFGGSGRAGAVLVALLVAAGAGRTIARNADWRDELTLWTATTASSPRSAKAHYNRGVSLSRAGRTGEALEEYLASIRIRDDDPQPHRNAGLILARDGRFAEALPHLQKAARYDPIPAETLVGLGVVYGRIGRTADAERALRAALADTGAAPAARRDAAYNLGTLLLAAGRAGEALGPLTQARALDPDDADGRFHLGLALTDAGRPGDAIVEMEAALRLAPGLAEAHLHLARACLRAGDRARAAAEARAAADAGLDLPPELQELLHPDTR